jgi:hypothetical protein
MRHDGFANTPRKTEKGGTQMAVTWRFIVEDKELVVHGLYRDGKVHNAKKIVVDGQSVSYVDENGKMFSTMVQNRSLYFGRDWLRRPHVIKDAIALGVVPKKATARLIAAEERRRANSERRGAARDILAYLPASGLKLSPKQMRSLRRKAAT